MSLRALPLILVLIILAGATPAQSQPERAQRDGERSDFAVVGGQRAEPGAWPAQAVLAFTDAPDLASGFFCGGTVITPTLVLSAAHCLATTGGQLTLAPDEVRIAIGATDLTDPTATTVAVTEIYAHPDYQPQTSSNDIALLRLDGPVDVPLQPLTPAARPDLVATDTAGTVVGFGAVDADGTLYTGELRQAEVPVGDQQACSDGYEQLDGLALELDVMICAGDPSDDPGAPSADSCLGDSGGPLLVPGDDGALVQVGITSFGGPLCGVDVPGVYTRVDAFLDYIDAVVAFEVEPSEVVDGGIFDLLPGTVTRVTGADPADPASLAIAVSQLAFPFDAVAQYAVLGRADDFADALTGSALAYGFGPLLFTGGGGLQADVAAELQRVVQPGGLVYLLGGDAALTPAVESDVEALGLTAVRLAGPTREGTAVAVAQEVVGQLGGVALDTVILATGGDWPDAVSAAQLAAWFGIPVLLTAPDALHPDTAAALESLAPSRLLVVGGTAAISDEVAVLAAATAGAALDRLGGDTRIGTAVAVAAEMRRLLEQSQMFPTVATVTNLYPATGYVDALAASMLSGGFAGIQLPTDPTGTELGAGTAAVTCNLFDVAPGIVLGTPEVVAVDVEEQLAVQLARTCG